ncbi:hypothetical protein [Nostoc sp. MG11]|uniref:hypothetical protein n=1 Tax=Nostoc sp. MG11 TaxID=2721166 RepID=UPI001867D1DA|nr:hypothetical protein [Nostoc sp. MG11]
MNDSVLQKSKKLLTLAPPIPIVSEAAKLHPTCDNGEIGKMFVVSRTVERLLEDV